MKSLIRILFATCLLAILSTSATADVYESNNTPGYIKKFVLISTVDCGGCYFHSFSCEHYLNYGESMSFQDFVTNSGDCVCYYVYSLGGVTWIPVGNPSVTGITGLPEVVCLGEDYDVTAESSGGALTALQWFGDAQILSQSGHSAVVRFNAFGSAKTLIAKNNVGSNPPQFTKTTDVPSISYSIPARNGDSNLPRSIPYNVNTTVTVTINGTTKPLKFKIIGSGGNNGQAAIQGSNTLSGSGNLVIKGTAQTVPGHAGQITIRTDTKPASTCGPSDGFSVCAHPSANEAIAAAPIYNPSKGVGITHRWVSDSGNNTHLNEVYVKEQITFLQNRQGSLQNLSGTGISSDFFKVNSTQYDQHRTASDSILISAFNSQGAGSYEDHQKDIFYCQRCGMTEQTARPSPNAGFKVLWSIFRPTGEPTRIDLKVEKVGANIDGTAPGTVASGLTNNPTIHTLQP